MDGWNTSLSYWVSVTFQGRTVSFREGIPQRKNLTPGKFNSLPLKIYDISQKERIVFQPSFFSYVKLQGCKKYWLFLGLSFYGKASNHNLKGGRNMGFPWNSLASPWASWISRTDGGNCSMILPGSGISLQHELQVFLRNSRKKQAMSSASTAKRQKAW